MARLIPNNHDISLDYSFDDYDNEHQEAFFTTTSTTTTTTTTTTTRKPGKKIIRKRRPKKNSFRRRYKFPGRKRRSLTEIGIRPESLRVKGSQNPKRKKKKPMKQRFLYDDVNG